MPNWCSNKLTISAVGTEAQAKFPALVQGIKEGKFLNTVVPVPEELYADEAHSYGGEHAQERDALRARLKEKYGYENAIDFCYDHWGTKWEVEAYIEEEYPWAIELSFDSAWAPPIGVYNALHEQGFNVQARYYEPGMCFGGIVTATQGDGLAVNHSDDIFNRNDLVRQIIDNDFGISDDQAMNEEEVE